MSTCASHLTWSGGVDLSFPCVRLSSDLTGWQVGSPLALGECLLEGGRRAGGPLMRPLMLPSDTIPVAA